MNRIHIHKGTADVASQTLVAVHRRGLRQLLVAFDGSYGWRRQRGASTLSMHAFGAALDFDYDQLGSAPQMNPQVVAVFERYRWTWGGRWAHLDGGHFQLASGH